MGLAGHIYVTVYIFFLGWSFADAPTRREYIITSIVCLAWPLLLAVALYAIVYHRYFGHK